MALWSAAIIFLLAYPFFWLVNTEVAVLIWLAMSLWTFWAGGASWPVAAYLAANSLISLVAVYLASERYRAEIFDGRPGDNSLVGERG